MAVVGRSLVVGKPWQCDAGDSTRPYALHKDRGLYRDCRNAIQWLWVRPMIKTEHVAEAGHDVGINVDEDRKPVRRCGFDQVKTRQC